MRRWLLWTAAVVVVLVAPGAARAAAPGDPDPAFGAGGVATLPSGDTFIPAVQSDGKILVGTDNLSVVRLNADGSRDASFGQAGMASISNSPPAGSCAAVLVLADGKILVAGAVAVPGQ